MKLKITVGLVRPVEGGSVDFILSLTIHAHGLDLSKKEFS